jgi:hypothetical protein
LAFRFRFPNQPTPQANQLPEQTNSPAIATIHLRYKEKLMRKRSAWIALAMSGSLLFAACSKDKASDSTPAETEAATAETEAAAAETEAVAETEAAAAETEAAAETGAAAETEAAATETAAAAGGATGASLKDTCPETIIIQTDWNPEAEHGALYQMLGDGYEVDTEKKTATGPLMDGTTDTGVKIQIRVGGPAIGFTPVSTQLFSDPAIHMGYIGTDDQIVNSASDNKTLAVVAPLYRNPQIIMWDPATYPDVKVIKDLKATKAKVRVFGPAAYLTYLVQDGQLDQSQIDGSYDGTPSNFIADNGKSAQQGFASSEPYFYQNVLEQWKKPVAFQTISDAGWDPYAAPLSIRLAEKDALAPCLKLFVPVVQRATRDFQNAPEAANARIIDLVLKYDTGWKYTADQAAAAVKAMTELKLVGNSADGVLGNFELDRVDAFIAKAIPIFKEDAKAKVNDALKATDIVTNEFIDPSIKL